MKGTLHTDSIPLCESSDDANSVEVICFTIHNTNPCHQSSHTFTFYLSIVSAVDSSSDDSIYSIAFKEIRESLSRRSESLQRFLGSMESISRSRGSGITCVGLLKVLCVIIWHILRQHNMEIRIQISCVSGVTQCDISTVHC